MIESFFSTVTPFFEDHLGQIIVTLALVVLFFISRKIVRKIIFKHAKLNKIAQAREQYIVKVVNFLVLIAFLLIVGGIWELSFQGLSIYFASIFTIIGVGLFATWSILSNITASIIIFFFFPYKIGARVKVMDGDNSVEGKIHDITLFNVKIRNQEEQVISFPNNLVIQKAVMQLA